MAAAFYRDNGLGLFHEDFEDEAAKDPDILALAAKVNMAASAECDAIYPYQLPAVLTAHLKDGTSVTEKILVNRGGPQNPLSDAELALKFESNVRAILTPEKAEQVSETIFGFATDQYSLNDLSNLIDVLI